MSKSNILRPFHSQRDVYSPRTVLVIADEGCLEIPEDLKAFTEGSNGLNVHYAKKLPLPCGNNHPPIDLIVFVYKVYNKQSLESIRGSMSYLDRRYYGGKCFILVYADRKYSPEDIKETEDFAKVHSIPMHYATKQKVPPDGKYRLHLPSELLSVYCPPIGSDVNDLIIGVVESHSSVSN